MTIRSRGALALLCAGALALGAAGCAGKTPAPAETAAPAEGELQRLADRYGITPEKVERILAVFRQDPGYTFEDLAGRTMEELDALLTGAVLTDGGGARPVHRASRPRPLWR